MSEIAEGETIVVTYHRYTPGSWEGTDSAARDYSAYVTVNPFGWDDIFEQIGGGEAPQTTRFEFVNGNLIVHLPGYTFTPIVPRASWNDMSNQQQQAFMKMMTEFQDSPKLVAAFDHFEVNNVTEIEIHYDDMLHRLDGSTVPFGADQQGNIDYLAVPGTNGVNIVDGSRAVISINSTLVKSATDFAQTLAHEFRHPLLPGMNGNDEGQAEHDGVQIWDEISSLYPSSDATLLAYMDGLTFYGSRYNDTAVGTAANDTMAGMSGNDVLNGGDGDDLVLGGAGMDVLVGGLGSNALEGGWEADIYTAVSGVTHDQITDIGGVDRLDLSAVSIQAVTFTRIGDSLFMSIPGFAAHGIAVTDQWVDAFRVEQFTFAEGTYAASYIESLAGTLSGVCYDDLGQPQFCSPYGLPIVLDLDGDGIELVANADSHVRFDVNGDGSVERVGWVSGDDGILALDRNGNGRIDDFSEISFRQDFRGAGSDLEGLYAYDTNHDGFLSANDERFADFGVWRDLNQNGKSEKHELFTLDQLGIVSIDLERRNTHALQEDADRNQILATSVFETKDGVKHMLGDVALFADMSLAELHVAIGSNAPFQYVSCDGVIVS